MRQTPEVLREGGSRPRERELGDFRPELRRSGGRRAGSGGTGCDAIVLHTSTWATLDYATSWTSLLRVDPAAYGEAIGRWVAHLRAEGIERIGSEKWSIRRRRSGRNWALALDTGQPEDVSRRRARSSAVRGTGLPSCPRRRGAARREPRARRVTTWSQLAVRSGSVVSAQVSLTGGLGLSMPLDQAGVDLLEQLAPGRSLREAAGEGAVPLVRALVERGFVVPA